MSKSLKIIKYTYNLVSILLSIYGGLLLNKHLEKRQVSGDGKISNLYLILIGSISGHLGYQTTKHISTLQNSKSFSKEEQFHTKAISGLIGFFFSMIYTSIFLYAYYKYL